MKKEKSCGAVVYKYQDGELFVLLLKHKNGGHWAFPKGHVEKNETEEETALREIKEETSLIVKLDTGFRETNSFSPKTDVIKDVIYFAAQVISGELEAQAEEITDIHWFQIEEAIDIATYDNDKKMLMKFKNYINS